MAPSFSVVLMNERREIARLADLVEAFGAEHGLDKDDVASVNLALDEVVANVIKHGYQGTARGEIHVSLTIDQESLVVEVRDEGRPFNPLHAPPPNLDLPLDVRTVGGLGLHIARSVVDSMAYRREGACNVLTMRKVRSA